MLLNRKWIITGLVQKLWDCELIEGYIIKNRLDPLCSELYAFVKHKRFEKFRILSIYASPMMTF